MEPILKISLIMKNISGSRSLVNFDFNTREEVPEQIAEELVKHLGLDAGSIPVILKALECRGSNEESEVPEKVPEKVPEQRTPSFHGKAEDRVLNFSIKLGIQENNMLKKVSVEINFDLDRDTVEEVAEHTVQELGLDSEDYPEILHLMKKKLLEIDTNMYSSYSCLELLDIGSNTEAISPIATRPHAHSNTTGSVASELKSPHSNLSKSSSFEMLSRIHPQNEDPFSGNLSPINSCVDAKNSFKSDEDEIAHRNEPFKGVISRKNVCNTMKDVKKLQEALGFILNAKIKPNGVYNKKTERLVKIFQAKNNMRADGVVNQKVWEDVIAATYSGAYYGKGVSK